MIKISNIWILIFAICSTSATAQSKQQPTAETTMDISDERQFLMYVDTMGAYVYRDHHIVEEMVNKCETILEQNSSISDSARVFYSIQKINYNLNYNQALKAYQVIVDHENLIQEKGIRTETQLRFSYLKAYTLMMLGELDDAQKVFYLDLAKTKLSRDTVAMASTLYSLGQLYGDKEDYEAAEKCYFDVFELSKATYIPVSTIALLDFELTNIYIKQQLWDKATISSDRGLAFSIKENVEILKPYFLAYQAEIALEKKQSNRATSLTKEVQALAKANGDPRSIKHATKLQATTYRHKGQYQTAIGVLHQMLADADTTQYDESLHAYEQLHQIYALMGNPDEAYEYVLKYNSTKEKQDDADRMQKTAFLKIKFDTEQQKAANQSLTIKVLQEQREKQWLYIMSMFFLTGMVALFAAFYQKWVYNQTLEKEVQKRTEELKETNITLKKSNEELDEFNRILAHDLREPLRSIVGFSQLAKAQKVNNPKVKDYVTFIEKSGRQLHQVINGITTYRTVNKRENTPLVLIDTATLVQKIKENTQNDYSKKDIQISTNTTLPSILGEEKVLQTVFKQLIDNGIKFNESEQAKIMINYESNEQFHVFEFADNGIGIDAQFHQQVFGMCKRLHTRDVYEGSGLGLSITQKMLENRGGRIAILESEAEKGSTFRVEVPVV